jgi:hypothetical protein
MPNLSLIKQYYENFDFPGVDKLFKIIKMNKPDSNISRQDIKTFIDDQQHEQIQKTKVRNNKLKGHVVAFDENELWLIDIFDLAKYKTTNSNYKYIFVAIDVFTRKAYAVKMKTKSIDDTTEAIKSIESKNSKIPLAIMSDNDTAFLGRKFKQYLDDNDIYHMTTILDDHRALGIIDNFAKRIKKTFGKYFSKNNSTNWIDYLDIIIQRYNNTPNSALYDLSPNDTTKNQKNTQLIQELNLDKVKDMKTTTKSSLRVGDNVRISVKHKYTKSNEPQFSQEIYKVESVQGNNLTLDNGKTYKNYNVLQTKEQPKKKIIKSASRVANEKHKLERQLRNEGLDENNIIRGKRKI